jgi:preprotein translocase subunit Sec63
MAKKYHPDKVARLPLEEQEGAKSTWEGMVKAYETLTNEDKFQNWLDYGDPEGSLVSQSIDIALPSWVMDPENQAYVLGGFFFCIILIPIGILRQLNDTSVNRDVYENGIDKTSGKLMLRPLFE